ncbi:MAG: gliding motility-associated C-terminal domain-containing protein, partial [Bacteroidetes bacterium]|nr:gliding motility-associated C-terminal domain-containing protein [Bacteroidota bacterium]
DNNCPDTTYLEYSVVFQGLYVPTGFTPDSPDQALRLFKPAGMNLEYYRITVINERGNIVFSSDKLDENGSPGEGWDGTTGGEPMPTANYLWTISAKFKDGRIWTGNDVGDGNTETSGFLLLIR